MFVCGCGAVSFSSFVSTFVWLYLCHDDNVLTKILLIISLQLNAVLGTT